MNKFRLVDSALEEADHILRGFVLSKDFKLSQEEYVRNVLSIADMLIRTDLEEYKNEQAEKIANASIDAIQQLTMYVAAISRK